MFLKKFIPMDSDRKKKFRPESKYLDAETLRRENFQH